MQPLTWSTGTCAASLLLLALFCGFASHRTCGPTEVELPQPLFFPEPFPTDNAPTVAGVALGRRLFYDPILSADRSLSCSSYHQQQAAFADPNSRFSTGVSGEPLRRNTMPLFNLGWTAAFFWDGRASTLEAQVLHPVRAHDEMNLSWDSAVHRVTNAAHYPPLFARAFGSPIVDSVKIARAIAQFERTLISSDSKYDQVLRGEAFFTPEEFAGFELMNDQTKGDCLHCHVTDGSALTTTGRFSNNGLDTASSASAFVDPGLGGVSGSNADYGRFRIPALRNVGVTAPYMHDGRFETLEEVLDFYADGVQHSLTLDSKMGHAHLRNGRLNETEKKAIIAFLHTLTDSTFLTNPAFGPPKQLP